MWCTYVFLISKTETKSSLMVVCDFSPHKQKQTMKQLEAD